MSCQYYEIEFGILAEGAQSGDYHSLHSVAIKADHWPTIDEAWEFVKDYAARLGCGFDCVNGVTRISEEEVRAYFDASSIDSWPWGRGDSAPR